MIKQHISLIPNQDTEYVSQQKKETQEILIIRLLGVWLGLKN
jgi:hypothetical protein